MKHQSTGWPKLRDRDIRTVLKASEQRQRQRKPSCFGRAFNESQQLDTLHYRMIL